MMKIEEGLQTPIISDEKWENAKSRLARYYEKSSNLALCLTILEVFEQSNKRKYKSDLEAFLHESKAELLLKRKPDGSQKPTEKQIEWRFYVIGGNTLKIGNAVMWVAAYFGIMLFILF